MNMDPDRRKLFVHEFAFEFLQRDAQFGDCVPIDITVEKHVPAGNLDDGEGKLWLHT
jgi:hypothetical protein